MNIKGNKIGMVCGRCAVIQKGTAVSFNKTIRFLGGDWKGNSQSDFNQADVNVWVPGN